MVPFFVWRFASWAKREQTKGRKMRDALMRLLEPSIEALGFELIDLELAQGVLSELTVRGIEPNLQGTWSAPVGNGARERADGLLKDAAAEYERTLAGAPASLAFLRHFDFEPPAASFDAAFRSDH